MGWAMIGILLLDPARWRLSSLPLLGVIYDGRLKESLSLTENHGEAETSFVLTHSSWVGVGFRLLPPLRTLLYSIWEAKFFFLPLPVSIIIEIFGCLPHPLNTKQKPNFRLLRPFDGGGGAEIRGILIFWTSFLPPLVSFKKLHRFWSPLVEWKDAVPLSLTRFPPFATSSPDFFIPSMTCCSSPFSCSWIRGPMHLPYVSI